MAPHAFSSELDWLLALMRVALQGGEAPAPQGVNWPRFAALVDRHRVGAWLQTRAPEAIATHCPPEIIRHFEKAVAITTHRGLTQGADLVRLVRRLEAEKIDVLVVKGLVLAQELYGRLGVRHVGDLDLAVRIADVTRADAVLQSTGLRRTRPHFPLTPLQTKKYLQFKPEFEYQRTEPAMRIELLWRFEGLRDDDAVWSGAVTRTLSGHTLRTLPPALNLPYIFQHGARHGWFRLFWLVDVALLLRDPAIDWDGIVAEARRLGLERGLLQGAALAEELLGVPRPTALRPNEAEARHTAALVAEARRQIARNPAENEPVGEWTRQALYRVRLQKGAREKFAMFAPHLFSPLNWATLPLPDRWYFLYYILTPFLWLWRRARRAA